MSHQIKKASDNQHWRSVFRVIFNNRIRVRFSKEDYAKRCYFIMATSSGELSTKGKTGKTQRTHEKGEGRKRGQKRGES